MPLKLATIASHLAGMAAAADDAATLHLDPHSPREEPNDEDQPEEPDPDLKPDGDDDAEKDRLALCMCRSVIEMMMGQAAFEEALARGDVVKRVEDGQELFHRVR